MKQGGTVVEHNKAENKQKNNIQLFRESLHLIAKQSNERKRTCKLYREFRPIQCLSIEPSERPNLRQKTISSQYCAVASFFFACLSSKRLFFSLVYSGFSLSLRRSVWRFRVYCFCFAFEFGTSVKTSSTRWATQRESIASICQSMCVRCLIGKWLKTLHQANWMNHNNIQVDLSSLTPSQAHWNRLYVHIGGCINETRDFPPFQHAHNGSNETMKIQ